MKDMKKKYEKPEMTVETVCVESLLAESLSKIESTTVDADDEAYFLGKERNDGNWGGLLW